jgi:hypothetical protein
MKLRTIAAAAALACATLAAQAQVGVGLYFNPVAIRVGNSSADTGPFAFLGQNSTSQVFYGYDFGGFYDFYRSGSITAGVDLRESDLHANNALLRSFMFGARLSAKPFKRPIKPYAQFSFGYGTTKAPANTVRISKFDYMVYGGVDYTLQKHIDFRVFEVGYGSLTTVSSADVGGGANLYVPAANQISFSSGLVFRF